MFKHQTASILPFKVSPPGFLSQQDDSLKYFFFFLVMLPYILFPKNMKKLKFERSV